MESENINDKNGELVALGDTVKVLKLPDIRFTQDELDEVNTMVGECFKVESISDGCVEVTKWWGSGDNTWCHTLFLWPNEFELSAKNNAS